MQIHKRAFPVAKMFLADEAVGLLLWMR